MPHIVQTVLSWFGGGVAVVVGMTGAAYWLFKTFSSKWLEARFSTRLEAYRHELSTLLDRATRLHAQEFEVLPNIWEKLTTSMDSALSVLSPLQLASDITYAMPDELEALLEKSTFLEHEKQKVRGAKTFERSPLYQRFEHGHRFRSAYTDWRAAHSYAVAKSIFIEPALGKKVRQLLDLIYEGLDAKHWADTDAGGWKEVRAGFDTLRGEGTRLRDEIEAEVAGRLRSAAEPV